MKQITISNKDYEITSNAYTRFQYKQVFNRKIFADIAEINEFKLGQDKLIKELSKRKDLTAEDKDNEINSYILKNVDDFIDIVIRFAYIFILSANPNFKSFEDWLKDFESISINEGWIQEVTELAVSSFHG